MKRLIPLISIIVVAITVIILIVGNSAKPNIEKNGFIRQFTTLNLTKIGAIEIPRQFTRIAGITNDSVFLYGRNPLAILTVNIANNTADSLKLALPIDIGNLTAYSMFINYPRFSFYDNNQAVFIKYNLGDTSFNIGRMQTGLFTRIAEATPQMVFLRAIDSITQNQVLKKVNTITGKVLTEFALFENKMDAGFSNDGMLQYDPSVGRLIFIQYYENKFFCLDTNLNVLYKGTTIDTTNTNSINAKAIFKEGQGGSIMAKDPPKIINKSCWVNNGKLFVVSLLQADNETNSEFNENTVVDVYNIGDGKYIHSFHVPKYNGEKMTALRNTDSKVIILYKGAIVVYEIQSTPAVKQA